MFIRHFEGHKDLDVLVEFEDLCFPNYGWSRSEYEDIIGDPDLVFFMVFESEEEKQIIAYGFGFKNQGDEFWFNGNAVHPDFRRKGLGNLMIALREVAARVAGDKRISVEMSTINHSSIAMHKKAGFKPTGEIVEKYYRNGEDALKMEKEL